jgi:hypothetical protein
MELMKHGTLGDLPIRSISTENLVETSQKTIEGKILDKQGVLQYCCRRMILTQPIEPSKFPFPDSEEYEKEKKNIKRILKI